MSSDGLRSARSVAIIVIVHLAVIVLWQVLVDAFQVPKFVLPSPLATLATLTSAKYAWLSNLAVTTAETCTILINQMVETLPQPG